MNKILVVVFKNLCPELSPFLVKLFNQCLKKCFPRLWRCIVCALCTRTQENPCLHHNIALSASLVLLANFIINKKVVEHLKKNKFIYNKQYSFHSSRSTIDVLTIIMYRLYEALNNISILRVITQYILKDFDKIWHRGSLHKFASYGISR